MARGKKSTELDIDATPMGFDEKFLVNTDRGLVQVGRSAIPAAANLLRFETSASSPIIVNEAKYENRFLSLNNAAGPIVIRLPDINDIWPNVADFRRGGLFMAGVVASANFPVTFEPITPGQIRAVSPGDYRVLSADEVFVGLRQQLADEAIVRVYIRGAFWVIECSAGWRETEAEFRDRRIAFTGSSNRALTDADHRQTVWITAAVPGTLTLQSDIPTGTVINIVNNGGGIASINFGAHTQVGDGSIAAGQASTVVVGDVTSGVNKNIFVASSS